MMKLYSKISVFLTTLYTVVQSASLESTSLLANKEHLNIFVDQYAADISSKMAESNRLSMLYVCHTGLDPDK